MELRKTTFPDPTPDSVKLSFQNPAATINTGSVLGRNASLVSELKRQERNMLKFCHEWREGAQKTVCRGEGGQGQQHNQGGPNEFASPHSNPQIITTTVTSNTDLAFTVGQGLSQVL